MWVAVCMANCIVGGSGSIRLKFRPFEHASGAICGKEAFSLHPGNAAHKICKSYEIQVIRMVEHLCMIALAFVHWSGRTKLVIKCTPHCYLG